jgi:hypothetical protein
MRSTMTIGERREELTALPLTKLRKLFRRVKREYGGNVEWVDRRKRADLIQAIINYEIGLGCRMHG